MPEENIQHNLSDLLKKIERSFDLYNKKLEDTCTTIERLDVAFGEDRRQADEEITKAKKILKLFCHEADLFSKKLEDLPEFVDKRLDEKMDRHLSRTTDHVFKEFERASQEHLTKLMKVTSSCSSAVERLKVRLGWRDYLPPAILSLVGFFAAFSVVWYFELGVAKVDIQTIGEASRMRELYYSATPAERKTVSKILYKYLPRR